MKNDQGIVMPVELEQLRAFDLNPRITRNPNYDEIKESIRHRGLEQLPQITRRPGEDFYIIASGGNTRLAILNELWLETHDKKYWNIICHYREWHTDRSIEEGNLDCLLGHLVENDKRGALTFIERALGVQNAVEIYKKLNSECYQRDLVSMLSQAGYSVSQTQLSIMSSTIQYLLPYIPELLYSGMSRKNTERLLTLRSNTERFWDKYCQEFLPASAHQVPLFDDIFAMALTSFNEPTADFSLEHIQDELTGLVSQTLNIDYNTVALVTDARAQKCNTILGSEPVPELPDISEQRWVEQKYRDRISPEESSQGRDHSETDTPSDQSLSDFGERETISSDRVTTPASNTHYSEPGFLSDHQVTSALPTDELFLGRDRQFDTQEALSALIDQMAWELAGNAGLEFLISPASDGIFDIASPEGELSNEGKIYWQILSFLAGKLPGSAVIWRKMLTGSPDISAGISEETLIKIFQLTLHIRHLYDKQRQGELL